LPIFLLIFVLYGCQFSVNIVFSAPLFTYTKEFAYDGLGYNDAFRRFRQNFYLLPAFEFGYIVTSPYSDAFYWSPKNILFVYFITTVSVFLYCLRYILNYVVMTE